jgi:hypothetical protein
MAERYSVSGDLTREVIHSRIAARKRTVAARPYVAVDRSRQAGHNRLVAPRTRVQLATCKRAAVAYSRAVADRTAEVDHNRVAADKRTAKGHNPAKAGGRFPWVDDRFPWVARRRTNIWCPRERVLSRSRSAMLPGGSVAKRKLTESKKDHARWAQRSAFVAPSAATMPRRLVSRS